MNLTLRHFAICSLLILSNLTLKAQSHIAFDSIAIKNIPHQNLTFKIQDDLLKKVSFKKSNPKHVQIEGKHVFGDFGRGLLTLVSGVGVENTKEDVDLKLTSIVKGHEEKYNWTVNLFVKGLYTKERSRYSTESGGFSMDIDRHASIHWEGGANGEIIWREKKIGEFVLIKRPNFDKLTNDDPLEFLNDSVQEANELPTMGAKKERSYVIYGSLLNQNFSVVADTKNEKYWLFSDGNLKSILQLPLTKSLSDDNNGYILLHPDMSAIEATYWIKLALYNAYLEEILSKTEYNW